MAPPAADVDIESTSSVPQGVKGVINAKLLNSGSRLTGPLKYSGSLDEYESFDVTSVIGREFRNLQVSQILHDDRKIRDLAILGE